MVGHPPFLFQTGVVEKKLSGVTLSQNAAPSLLFVLERRRGGKDGKDWTEQYEFMMLHFL
jgi:hypothetical protein